MLEKYNNLFDIFSKKDSETISLYWIYNCKIHLKKDQRSDT